MSYLYTDTAPQTVKPLDQIQNPQSSIINRQSLDPDLPLIRMDVSQTFAARSPDGKLHGGRIHPQRMSKDSDKSHPSLFYVEFPAGSANYYEVSIPKLTRILGEGDLKSFTITQAARILSAIPRRHHFLNLITIARP